MIDPVLLEDVLSHIHNWFVRDTITVRGCEIDGGALPSSVTADLLTGQWYRIRGSVLNDGLHLNPDTQLADETFDGYIDSLAIPRPLLRVVEDIATWQTAYGSASDGPYASESFEGYSYTLKSDTGANSASGSLSGWRLAYRDRLNPWRKIS